MKVLAFMICRGDETTKVNILYDMIWSMKDAKQTRPTITWCQVKLKQIFKKIFYFSEIYPKKFQKAFQEELTDKNFYKKYKIRTLPSKDN